MSRPVYRNDAKTELEYTDEITLGRSIKNRTDFESSIS